mgnify:CR=1 FL=1
MSRPRFLADHNLSEAIVRGVKRVEPEVEFLLLRDLMPIDTDDPQVLEYAASHELIVVTHDRRTMPRAAYERMARGQSMHGLILVVPQPRVGPIISDLILIWSSSQADEWPGRVAYLSRK